MFIGYPKNAQMGRVIFIITVTLWQLLADDTQWPQAHKGKEHHTIHFCGRKWNHGISTFAVIKQEGKMGLYCHLIWGISHLKNLHSPFTSAVLRMLQKKLYP